MYATVTAVLHEAGDRTRVTVDTDLKIVGKLAQFGSGMLQQVSEKLLGQFVESLEAKLAAENTPADTAADTLAGTAPDAETPAPRVVPAPAPAEPAPIDLLDLAGGTALKKYAPMVFAAFAAVAVLFALGRLRLARRVRRDRR